MNDQHEYYLSRIVSVLTRVLDLLAANAFLLIVLIAVTVVSQ